MSLDLFCELSRDLFCIRESNGYFEPLNSAWENLLGWTRKELRSRLWSELIHPDDVQVSLNAETQFTQTDVVEYENRYRHKNGSYRWLAWRVSRQGDGCVYAVAKNITAEKELEEQLHLLLDAANMGFWHWDIQSGSVTLSNHLERLFGLAPNTFDGTFAAFFAIIHPDDRDRFHQATRHSLETGKDSDI